MVNNISLAQWLYYTTACISLDKTIIATNVSVIVNRVSYDISKMGILQLYESDKNTLPRAALIF